MNSVVGKTTSEPQARTREVHNRHRSGADALTDCARAHSLN